MSIIGRGQSVSADPSLAQLTFESISNTSVDPNILGLGEVVQLKVPILNLNTSNALPAGSCKIKIGLGSKIELDPSFNLNTTNTSTYFNWTSETQGGQVMLTGELIATLPPSYTATGIFLVKGVTLGGSTVTGNFLVTNHNTAVFLSDEEGSNNTSALAYNVVQPIPVTFTGISAVMEGCSTIKVYFSSENEVNVDRYEIETSNDGINFNKAGSVSATGRINYSYSLNLFPDLLNTMIIIRIKAIDKDGSFQYSKITSARSTCKEKTKFTVYPNPIRHTEKYVTVFAAGTDIINRLSIELFDISGRKIYTANRNLLNTRQFNLDTDQLAVGQYIIKIFDETSREVTTLAFIKY